MIRTILATALLLATASMVAWAAETVSQKDKQFSSDALTIKPGDTVTFKNDDQVTHDLTVTRPDGSTTPGVMEKPGEQTTITFDKPGEYQVHCMIHPKMKMTVTAR